MQSLSPIGQFIISDRKEIFQIVGRLLHPSMISINMSSITLISVTVLSPKLDNNNALSLKRN
jgi:hypothetical protein